MLPPLSRADRRNLRWLLGRARGVEWRYLGHCRRRWRYLRESALPGVAPVETSREGGWTRREPVVPPVLDPAVDALNTEIVTRARTVGHVGRRATS